MLHFFIKQECSDSSRIIQDALQYLKNILPAEYTQAPPERTQNAFRGSIFLANKKDSLVLPALNNLKPRKSFLNLPDAADAGKNFIRSGVRQLSKKKSITLNPPGSQTNINIPSKSNIGGGKKRTLIEEGNLEQMLILPDPLLITPEQGVGECEISFEKDLEKNSRKEQLAEPLQNERKKKTTEPSIYKKVPGSVDLLENKKAKNANISVLTYDSLKGSFDKPVPATLDSTLSLKGSKSVVEFSKFPSISNTINADFEFFEDEEESELTKTIRWALIEKQLAEKVNKTIFNFGVYKPKFEYYTSLEEKPSFIYASESRIIFEAQMRRKKQQKKGMHQIDQFKSYHKHIKSLGKLTKSLYNKD